MKIKIHESLIFLLVLALLSGYVHKIIIIYSLVMLHELGHLYACKKYERKLSGFTFIPFGAIIYFDEDANRGLIEDIIIALSGIAVNIAILIIFRIMNYQENAYEYNLIILFINILPIYPLDGGRIVEILLMKIMSFRRAVVISKTVSLMLIVFLFFGNILRYKSFGLLLVLVYLFGINFKAILAKEDRYNSFLIKKYLYPNPSLKDFYFQYFHNGLIKRFKKGVNNNFGDNHKNRSEKEILRYYFEKK